VLLRTARRLQVENHGGSPLFQIARLLVRLDHGAMILLLLYRLLFKRKQSHFAIEKRQSTAAHRQGYKNVRLKDTTDMPSRCERNVMFSRAHEASFHGHFANFLSKFAQPLKSNL
jgi:hypothetical protein